MTKHTQTYNDLKPRENSTSGLIVIVVTIAIAILAGGITF